MKKIYFFLILSTVLTTVSFGQAKKILFVGGDEELSRTSDIAFNDSLVSWGYDVTYMGTTTYGATANVHNGMDGIVFSESIGSGSAPAYKTDNFPIPCITFEAGVFGAGDTKWDFFTATGGIMGTSGTVDDLVFKITNNTHYITEIYEMNQEIKVADPNGVNAVPLIQGLKYNAEILAVPIITVDNNQYSMCVIEDAALPSKICWMSCTHYNFDDEGGTPEFFVLFRRTTEYIFDAIPVGKDELELNADNNINLRVFPNPANSSEKISVRFDNVDSNLKATLSVFDLAGRNVETIHQNTMTGYNFIEINTNNLATGVYIAKLSIGENSVFSKFLVQ